MQTFYTILFLHLLPFMLLRMYWRSIKAPAYRQRMHERFALIPQRQSSQTLLWVHAVSVGETIAATPLIKQLQTQHPELAICITTTTPTGSERVLAAFGDSVLHYYLPYDVPSLMARFIRRLQPKAVVIMETELWPNMLAVCAQNGVPALLANGRMSQRSQRGYQRFSTLTRPMLQTLHIAAQCDADAQRFIALGAVSQQVTVTGSIKLDVSRDTEVYTRLHELQQQLQVSTRRIAIFASTHSGEDEQILKHVKALREHDTSFLAFIVPRHPERFSAVQALCDSQQLSAQQVSDAVAVKPETAVLIGDTMGDMLSFYGLADIAFIGGSLINHGGHNFLEAAVWGLPCLSGPAVFNFQSLADALEEAGGLKVVEDATAMKAELQLWLEDDTTYTAMGQAGAVFLKANQGALQRLLHLINTSLLAP